MIQNMPAVVDRDALQQQINAIREEGNANRQQMTALFEQGVAQLRDRIAQGQAQQLRGDILQLQGQVGPVQNERQLLPIRLYNAFTSELAPSDTQLQYRMTIYCRQPAITLGLPGLPANTLVEDRRRLIADYIGVPHRKDALTLPLH